MKKFIVFGLAVALVAIIAVGAWIRTTDRVSSLAGGAVITGGNSERPGVGWGQNQTAVTDWQTVKGTVTSVDSATLVIKTDAGEFIVENRPWSFALEQKFSAQIGDQIQVTGFSSNGYFQVAKLVNATNGKTIVLRDEYGRPGWSGRGRNGGG
ncbi:MAG: hypothetical protein HY868_26135 [Chloroflexi bacterium]|nr:hypothetical protein [Chloroflexota bacterium]